MSNVIDSFLVFMRLFQSKNAGHMKIGAMLGKCSLYVGKLFYIITTTKKYRTSHIVKCSVISMQKS